MEHGGGHGTGHSENGESHAPAHETHGESKPHATLGKLSFGGNS
jgi:hypothetical protein